MEDPEARKARLAALRQAKAAASGVASTGLAASVPPSSASQSSSTTPSTLGEKRKASDSASTQKGERVFDGDEEIVEVEDMAESEVDSDKFLKFRNYRPRDTEVEKKSTLIERATPANVDEQIAGILALAKQSAADPFLNIAPKKLNWDLKREVAERLEILNKRTTRVINEIVAEKMKELEDEEESGSDADESDDEPNQSGQFANNEEIDLE